MDDYLRLDWVSWFIEYKFFGWFDFLKNVFFMLREVVLLIWERGNLVLYYIGVLNCVISYLGWVKWRCLVGFLVGIRYVC